LLDARRGDGADGGPATVVKGGDDSREGRVAPRTETLDALRKF